MFQWPGLGLLFIQAVNDVDIPIMSAYLMLTGLMFVIINFAVDLLYRLVDPRLRGDEAPGRRMAAPRRMSASSRRHALSRWPAC